MNICIYGASSSEICENYIKAAESLGKTLALAGHTLVFGGGASGLMGAVAEGFYQGKGQITGIAPDFFDKPGVFYEHCTDFIKTKDMRQRKALMEERAEVFIALPGGIGTLDELFEIMTLRGLGRHTKPVILYNTDGFYDKLSDFLDFLTQEKFMRNNPSGIFKKEGERVDENAPLYYMCDAPSQVLDVISATNSFC